VFIVRYWTTIAMVVASVYYAYYFYQRKRWRRKPDEKFKMILALVFAGTRLTIPIHA
jgi:O-antigen/teichoic acid export membrane protein